MGKTLHLKPFSTKQAFIEKKEYHMAPFTNTSYNIAIVL